MNDFFFARRFLPRSALNKIGGEKENEGEYNAGKSGVVGFGCGVKPAGVARGNFGEWRGFSRGLNSPKGCEAIRDGLVSECLNSFEFVVRRYREGLRRAGYSEAFISESAK